MIRTEVDISSGIVNINLFITELVYTSDRYEKFFSMRKTLIGLTTNQFVGMNTSDVTVDSIKAFADAHAPLLYLLMQVGVNV